ncbi:MAG: hypothetical protein LC116_05175 [Bacteroidetes bacterium]|nr:hypothetical protein [Bacteroidota bacterium]
MQISIVTETSLLNCRILRYATVIAVAFASFSAAYGQMFDWQYSVRLPFDVPGTFVGGGASFLESLHSATNFGEIGEDLQCGDYRYGSGAGFSVFASGEHWHSGQAAIGARLEFSRNYGKFTSAAAPVPFKLHGEIYELRREFALAVSLSSISAEVYGKWLVGGTHLHVGVSIAAGITVGKRLEQTESVIAPEEFAMAISYGESQADNISALSLRPALRIGYDAELGRGLYATPFISMGVPVFATSGTAGWRIWTFALGAQFNYGILGVLQ